LEVRAPGAIAAVEGTTFQLDVSEDGTTVLTVAEGRVQFFNELGNVTVLSSQQSTAQVGQAPTRPIVVDPSSLTAWEANLRTLIVALEYPLVSTDPGELEQELVRRQQAVEERPEDPAAHASLAEALLDLHRTEEAIGQAERAVELAPDQGALHGVLGYSLLQAGRPGEAGEEIALASDAEPDEARWQVGLALVALGQRDGEPAAELLRQAAQLAPDDALPRAYLAAAYLRAGDLESAAASASEAASLDPDSYLANTYLAYVHLAQGRLDDAVTAARRAVDEAPQSALAHEALGSALTFAGQLPEARLELDRALELNPLSAGSHLARSKLLAAEGEIEAARQEAQVAVGLNPESAPARSTLGLLFLLNNDPERAGRQFEQALARDPSLSEARTGWGVVLSKRGRFREAVEQQKLAVSLDTDSASAQNNLGGVYASLGQMERAIEHLKRAIELQPGWGMPYANLSLVHLEQNRFREALDAGERAVALGERSAFTHTVLARIYMRQGRTDRARAELRQAVALDEHYPQARFQLARLHLEQGRSRDALREILTSVAADPSAMLETRLYARTESTLAAGSHDRVHYDMRHSDQADDGRLSYFGSLLLDDNDGFRSVNQDESEKFLEVIVGHQSRPTRQLVFFGTLFDREGGLPGPATGDPPGDLDDRQDYTGYEAVIDYRPKDTNPFRELTSRSTQHSPEIRVEAALNERSSLNLGYTRLWDRTRDDGVASLFDPSTGDIIPGPFAVRSRLVTDTAWLEVATRYHDRFHLTLGGYWGQEAGTSSVLSPKVVALYRPDRATLWSFVVNPLFRSNASELAPVEALADPKGLRALSFAGGGVGRSYELRYQRQGNRSSTVTGSLAYQQVRDLLIDVEDSAVTGLPARLLLDRGHRWVADAAYEQWLTDTVTGRTWVRWQSSHGRFPHLQVSGTEWPHSPEWQAGGRLDYISVDGLRIGLEAVSVGSRLQDPEDAETVGSYFLLNLRIQSQRDLRRNYFIAVTNLTGKDYETFAGFPQPGRTILAGLEYRH
jgi:tetratricopeptide (TPR) repeat protein